MGRYEFSYELRIWFISIENSGNKKVNIHWEKKSTSFVMVIAIPWILMPPTKYEGLSYPTPFLRVGVVLLGIIFLNSELNKPHLLANEMIFMHC